MIVGSFRNTAAALALVFVALAGCTGERAATATATNGAAPASALVATSASEASGSGGNAVTGTDLDDLCAEDDIACRERFYQLEETLLLYEGGIANRIGERARACWQSDGEAFRRALGACGDNACRETALRERLASLHYLQAEEHRTSLDLPEAPQLIAVLGPETETTPPDDGQAPVPFEARGSLIHASAHPEHMGIAVNAASGEEHVFIHDMDINNQPDHDEVLGLVGTSPTAQVLVRGYRRLAPDAVANFDTARCRLAYQLP